MLGSRAVDVLRSMVQLLHKGNHIRGDPSGLHGLVYVGTGHSVECLG